MIRPLDSRAAGKGGADAADAAAAAAAAAAPALVSALPCTLHPAPWACKTPTACVAVPRCVERAPARCVEQGLCAPAR